MGPLAIAALASAGIWGMSKLFGPTKRFVGDVAKTGDEVYVSPTFLTNVPQLPPNTLWVVVKVLGGDRERIQGPIVGWQNTPHIPAALGSYVVQRKDIFRVVRDGKTIATNG